MTQLEKAIELIAKYKSQSFGITTNFQHFKQCALIAVDEIIEANPIAFDENDNCIEKNWWKEVKKEIEKL
jgi:hypothetical protein